MINVAVEKTATENPTGLIRRFTKRVQDSGVIRRVRSLRYETRNESSYVRRKKALKGIARKAEVEVLVRLGKMQENRRGR